MDKQIAHAGDQLSYSLVLGNGDFPSCRAEQITVNIKTPDGVVHPLSLSRTILNPGESDSYDNVVTYTVRAQDVRNGIVVGSASLAAVINQNIVNENATSLKEVNTVVVNPAITIQATCQGGVGEFAPITFSGTVRNTGDVRLTGVGVTNSLTGERVLGPIDLLPGASAPFNGSFVPPGGCRATAVLVATGTDAIDPTVPFSPQTVSASASITCSNTTQPEIKVTKICPEVPPNAGSPLTYRGVVENLGNVTLTNIVVMSDRPSGNTLVFTKDLLAPGEQATFEASYPTPPDSCSVSDTLRASGRDRCSGVTVNNSVTTTCPLAVSGSMTLTVNCPQNPPTPGSGFNYAISVRNTGTVTLIDVVVIDEARPLQPVARIESLSPNAVANFNVGGTAPTSGCTVSAVFAATAKDRCGGTVPSSRVPIECPVATAPAIVISHDCPLVTPAPGESTSVVGTLRNTGNVILTDVVVRDGSETVFGPVQLNPGQSLPFTAEVTVPADSCSFVTTLVATGRDACGDRTVSNTSTRTCPVKTNPSLVLTKQCPAVAPLAGTPLVQTGSIQNNGDITLTDVTVSRDGTRIFGPVTLAPGASAGFTNSITAPTGVCAYSQTWSASGRDKCNGQTVSQNVTSACPIVTNPQITVTLDCPTAPLTPGSLAQYGGVVSNPGSVTLTNIVVTDERNPGTPVFVHAALAPGASAQFTVSAVVPTNVCTLTVNVAANGASQCNGELATASNGATCPVVSSPALTVVHNCPAQPGVPGLPSNFGGRVTNSGNVTLTNVTVVATVLGSAVNVFGPATLEPGQAADFTGTYTIPQSASGCTFESIVVATGNNRCNGASTSAQNSISCSLSFTPGIEVVFRCPPNALTPGQDATYSGTVRNVGNVPLNNIKVLNSLTGDTVVFSQPALARGEAVEFTGTYSVPTNCCSLSSTLTATAVDECQQNEVRDTSTGTCPVLYEPKIAVTKVCPTEIIEPGDTMNISGTVSNPGNISLENVLVVHTVAGVPRTILGPIVLAPGQTVSYKTNFVVPADFCEDLVTATGEAICEGSAPVTASDNTRCPVRTMAMIMVEKRCPVEPVQSGGLFTFTGTVSNAGNVTLTDVYVYNSLPTNGTRVIGPITLAPGASTNFVGSYVTDGNCCETTDVLTAQGVELCNRDPVENTAATVCPIDSSPAISVTKVCGVGDAFTGIVQNTGDITLTNVVVVANIGISPPRLLGPLELAPGESAGFSGSAPTSTVIAASGTSVCNREEVAAAADCSGPVNPGIRVIGVTVASNGYTISWTSNAGETYRVQYKNLLDDPTWTTLPGDVLATGEISQKTDPDLAPAERFYQITLVE